MDEYGWSIDKCDALTPTVYVGQNGKRYCRCLVCARCKHHTGNNNQGHFWSYCSVTHTVRSFHFCCPDNCQLEENVE